MVHSNVRVRLRDGVSLATDVHRPARNGVAVAGRFPVILERTPYGRNITYSRDCTAADPTPKSRAQVAEYYVRHGHMEVHIQIQRRAGTLHEGDGAGRAAGTIEAGLADQVARDRPVHLEHQRRCFRIGRQQEPQRVG